MTIKTTKKPVRLKPGQPTKYDPKYCDMIIEHLEGGLSIESFAGVIGVSRDSIYEWKDKHQEFSDSIKTGIEKSLLFWEKLGRAGTTGKIKGFNCSTFIFTMKNRFKWTDRIESNVSANVNVTPKVIFGTDPDDDTGN